MATSRQICLTVPTLHGVRVTFDRFYRDIVLAHSNVTAMVFLLLAFQPKLPFQTIRLFFYIVPKTVAGCFLSCLGFDRKGVRGGSIASAYQSRYHGGYVPTSSPFSRYQSYGATPLPTVVVRVEDQRDEESAFWFLFRFGYFILALHFLFIDA